MAETPELPPDFQGRHVDSWLMADEMSKALIRLWCEVLEDANPLYHDESYATASRYGTIIPPPTMIMPLCSRPEWTPEGPATDTKAGLAASLPGYPNAASLEIVQTYIRPIRLAERPVIHFFESDPSPEKMTERGPGRIVIRYNSLRDGDGLEIASHSMEILRFRTPDAAPPPPAAARETVKDPEPSDGELLHRRGPQEPPLYWQDAIEGQSLGSLYIPLTLKRCIKWVAATRDYYEVHHDPEFARSVGGADLFIGVHFFHGLMGRYATDWSGPHGELRRLEIHSLGRAFPGDLIHVTGTVHRVFRDGDTGKVDLAISCANARGQSHHGTVTLALPDR